MIPNDVFEGVVHFQQEALERKGLGNPGWPEPEKLDLCSRLIREEVVEELLPAIDKKDMVGVADGIADSIFVLLQLAFDCGINMRGVWDEVMRANMEKKGGPRRADGKILKPPGWSPPNVELVLQKQGWRKP
jgi:predicted HAD superfamily Cof-like phosphohydrolase